MFRNYLKIAFRNLKKNKLYSFINISGLAIGMALSILILSYVWFELSFDRFHTKFDQVYMVVATKRVSDSDSNWSLIGGGIARVLKEEFPEVLHSLRLSCFRWIAEITYNEKHFIEEPGALVLADQAIFDIFDIPLISGKPETALQNPNSVVLTVETAKKYFGDKDPIGKILDIKQKEGDRRLALEVTGIAKAMPVNSHFNFDYLISYNTIYRGISNNYAGGSEYVYIVVPPDYQIANLESKLPQIVEKYTGPQIAQQRSTTFENILKSGGYYRFGLQPLKDVHLDNYYFSGGTLPMIIKGNRFHVNMYLAVAFLIIILACINFIILSTARYGERAREVGIRKAAGAKQIQLILQFITESLLLVIFALVFATVIIAILSKPMNNLLAIQTVHDNLEIVFIAFTLLAFTLVVGVIAGSYPAFFLSSFKPVNVLKGQISERIKGMNLRNSLVITQFIISIILIISSIIVHNQFVYMQNKDLGFQKDNILIIKNLRKNLWSTDKTIPTEERELRNVSLRQEILKNPSVINASYLNIYPGRLIKGGYNWLYLRVPAADSDLEIATFASYIDHAYFDVFELEMADGRNFTKTTVIPQTTEGVILNETAVKFFHMDNPIGKYVFVKEWKKIINSEGKEEWKRMEVQTPIIGVFKDYHNRRLHSKIRPTVYFPLCKGRYAANLLAVKLMPGNISEDIDFLKNTFSKFSPDGEFEYAFLDSELDKYNSIKKLAWIFTFFTILAILIACLGIFGLAAFTAEKRTREIGIRKAFGASIKDIVQILCKKYLKLTLLAFVIAVPAGYLIMNKWLQKFSYHIDIGATIFIYTLLVILVVVISSVSYHSIKAALTNPARTLKYE